jgi:hypothetical protein
MHLQQWTPHQMGIPLGDKTLTHKGSLRWNIVAFFVASQTSSSLWLESRA